MNIYIVKPTQEATVESLLLSFHGWISFVESLWLTFHGWISFVESLWLTFHCWISIVESPFIGSYPVCLLIVDLVLLRCLQYSHSLFIRCTSFLAFYSEALLLFAIYCDNPDCLLSTSIMIALIVRYLLWHLWLFTIHCDIPDCFPPHSSMLISGCIYDPLDARGSWYLFAAGVVWMKGLGWLVVGEWEEAEEEEEGGGVYFTAPLWSPQPLMDEWGQETTKSSLVRRGMRFWLLPAVMRLVKSVISKSGTNPAFFLSIVSVGHHGMILWWLSL